MASGGAKTLADIDFEAFGRGLADIHPSIRACPYRGNVC